MLVLGIFALIQRNSAVAALDVAQRSGLASLAANSELEIGEIDLSLSLAMLSVGNNDADMLPENTRN